MKLRKWRWGWAVAALVAGSQIWAWSQTPESRPRTRLASVRAIEAPSFSEEGEIAAATPVAPAPAPAESAPRPEATTIVAVDEPTPPSSPEVAAKTEAAPAPPAPETITATATPAPPVIQAIQNESTATAAAATGAASSETVAASNETATRPNVRLALQQYKDRGEKVVAAAPLNVEPTEPEAPRAGQTAGSTYDGVATDFRPLTGTTKNILKRAAAPQKLPQADFAAKHFEGIAPLSTDAVRSTQAPPRLTGPTAGDFCYRPLYFQEVNLERYGSSWGFLQPAVSGARFFATVPALPYLMAVDNPNECYDWSYPYPAGFPAPRVRELPPLSIKGGLLEAGVWTGLIFLIP